jgi:acylphosphatase
MKRVVIIAKGNLLRTLYRDKVERVARTLNLCGYVANSKHHDVLIVAEGEDEQIEQFIKRIKISHYPCNVEELIVNEMPYQGEFEYFEIRRDEWYDELGELYDTWAKILARSIEKVEKAQTAVNPSERSGAPDEKKQATDIAQETLWDFLCELGKRKISYTNITREELHEEVAAL